LEGIGRAVAGGPVSAAGRWVAANARWLRVAVGLLGAVVLLWGNDVSLSRLVWSLVLVVALLAVVQILVGAGRATAASRPVPPAGAVPEAAK
jgi:membrane protein YdbS with pleckstrin-like domain